MDAVILAAGEGTRLRPLTSTRPKPMLPVAGKPILEWTLEALVAAGVKKIVMVVGYRKDVIQDYFKNEFAGVPIQHLEQVEQLGTGHAVQQAKGEVSGTFIVLNGDVLISPELITDFLAHQKSSGFPNCMCLTRVQEPSHYGIAKVDEKGQVISIIEKPKEEVGNLANAGVYVFDQEIFTVLENIKKSKRLEYEVTSAIKALIEEEKMGGHVTEHEWVDIGLPWDLLTANESLVKKQKAQIARDAKVEDYTVLKGDVSIGAGTLIKSGAYIEGPVVIGENCVVGPNCFIRAHTCLMDKVKVGNAVEIKNSIIMSGTCIGHLSYVGDSIIGEKCNFGAGTKVANLKFDDSEVRVEVRESIRSSGRRKMGCLMGDGVKTGINVSIMPGRSIYPKAVINAASLVENTIYTEE